MKVKSLSRVQLLATLWTTAFQAPPSMGFSRQEYWNGKIKEQRGLYLRDFNAFNRKPTHVKKMILVEAPSTWTEKTEIVQNEKWPGGGTATLYKQEDDRESNPFANIGYFLCKRNND